VFERALNEHQIPIVLPILQVLGERGEVRTARAPGAGPPQGIVRALYYPDRRVQFAAVQAMLRMPQAPAPVAATRIVDLLARFVAADAVPRAMLIHTPPDRTNEYRQALKEAGIADTVAKPNINAAMEELKKSADFDVILVHSAAGAELTNVVSQLRADRDIGLLPLLIISPGKDRPESLVRLAERYRHTWVLTDLEATGLNLKELLWDYIAFSSYGPLSPVERRGEAVPAQDPPRRNGQGGGPR